MTKAEMKKRVAEWNRSIGKKYFERQREIMEELQKLNAKNGNEMWCSVYHLMQDLANTEDYWQAYRLAEEYHQIQGQRETLKDFLLITENFNL